MIKIAFQDGSDGAISRIIPIKTMIQLLMDSRDARIEELQSQVDKLLNQAKQNLDLEKQKELQKLVSSRQPPPVHIAVQNRRNMSFTNTGININALLGFKHI